MRSHPADPSGSIRLLTFLRSCINGRFLLFLGAGLHHGHEFAKLVIRRRPDELIEDRQEMVHRRSRPAFEAHRVSKNVAMRVVEEPPRWRPRHAAFLQPRFEWRHFQSRCRSDTEEPDRFPHHRASHCVDAALDLSHRNRWQQEGGSQGDHRRNQCPPPPSLPRSRCRWPSVVGQRARHAGPNLPPKHFCQTIILCQQRIDNGKRLGCGGLAHHFGPRQSSASQIAGCRRPAIGIDHPQCGAIVQQSVLPCNHAPVSRPGPFAPSPDDQVEFWPMIGNAAERPMDEIGGQGTFRTVGEARNGPAGVAVARARPEVVLSCGFYPLDCTWVGHLAEQGDHQYQLHATIQADAVEMTRFRRTPSRRPVPLGCNRTSNPFPTNAENTSTFSTPSWTRSWLIPPDASSVATSHWNLLTRQLGPRAASNVTTLVSTLGSSVYSGSP